MSAPPTLVVLRALGLGDLLTGVPALRALAAAFPDHRRLLLAPAWAADLLGLVPGASPVVHGVVATDFTGAVGGIDVAAPVRSLGPTPTGGAAAAGPVVGAATDHDPHRDDGSTTAVGDARRTVPARPDVAVNLHGRGPDSHRRLEALRPGRLIAFDAPAAGHRGPAWDPDEHEVRRWCRLLSESGIPADATALRLEPPPIAAPGAAVGATLLHPGAAAPARRWPPDRWAAVARAVADEGRRVVITGGRSEVALAERIATAADLGDDAVLAGRTPLRTLAAAVAAAESVVCGDTGVAHLATALGTPSVLLFGPTPPARWGPLINARRHRVLWAGRHGDPHAGRPDPGLLAITTGAVLDSVRALRRETVG